MLRKEDLDKKSKLKIKNKLFLRPDKIKLTSSKTKYDIELSILNCTFNGKCFEVLGETKKGNSIMIYLSKKLEIDKTFSFEIES